MLTAPSKMTDVYEGSLIRMFRRLEELIRQMAQASKVMGSEDLEKKFEACLTMVKRGMFFHTLNSTRADAPQILSPLRRSICNDARREFVYRLKLPEFRFQ